MEDVGKNAAIVYVAVAINCLNGSLLAPSRLSISEQHHFAVQEPRLLI